MSIETWLPLLLLPSSTLAFVRCCCEDEVKLLVFPPSPPPPLDDGDNSADVGEDSLLGAAGAIATVVLIDAGVAADVLCETLELEVELARAATNLAALSASAFDNAIANASSGSLSSSSKYC